MTLELDDDFAVMDQGRDHRLRIKFHISGVELIAAQNVDVDAFPRQ